MNGAGHREGSYAPRVRRLEQLLVARGIIAPSDLEGVLDAMLRGAPLLGGARIVARAWVDRGFRDRLLENANEAVRELGLSMDPAGLGNEPVLRCVENTAEVHNLVVCTVCSCYPVAILGPSPPWYESEEYRSRAVSEPRAVLAQFGVELPASTRVDVWDASREVRYVVLPRQPARFAGRGEDELVRVVSRRALIGTSVL